MCEGQVPQGSSLVRKPTDGDLRSTIQKKDVPGFFGVLLSLLSPVKLFLDLGAWQVLIGFPGRRRFGGPEICSPWGAVAGPKGPPVHCLFTVMAWSFTHSLTLSRIWPCFQCPGRVWPQFKSFDCSNWFKMISTMKCLQFCPRLLRRQVPTWEPSMVCF